MKLFWNYIKSSLAFEAFFLEKATEKIGHPLWSPHNTDVQIKYQLESLSNIPDTLDYEEVLIHNIDSAPVVSDGTTPLLTDIKGVGYRIPRTPLL